MQSRGSTPWARRSPRGQCWCITAVAIVSGIRQRDARGSGQGENGVAADTLPVDNRIEKDVDRRVPVRRLLLLAVLHHSADRSVEHDGEPGGGQVVKGPLRGRGLITPAQRTSGVPRIRRRSGTCSAMTSRSTTRCPRSSGPAVMASADRSAVDDTGPTHVITDIHPQRHHRRRDRWRPTHPRKPTRNKRS